MMAAVFLMQPLGQLASALVSLVIIAIAGNFEYTDKAMDQVWRASIGSGALPALFSLFSCLMMPESPRYTLDVAHSHSHDISIHRAMETRNQLRAFSLAEMDDQSVNEATSELSTRQLSTRELKQYFLVEGNWRYLLGTSFCWFSLNCALWGLGANNQETLAWLWNQSLSEPVSIYSQIGDYAKREMILVSIGAIVGCLALLTFINIASRKQILVWSFLCLAVLFIVTGGIIVFIGSTMGIVGPGTHNSAIVITLYVLCHVTFNLGKAGTLKSEPSPHTY
jgi:MFS transporter, PHS family, inorganic phosphate transporter